MKVCAGIDVAKDTLAVVVRPGGEGWTVTNTSTGHAALCQRLHELGVERVVLEATGGYERAVLMALAASGLSAVRVDPRRARSFARVVGRAAKTDPIDAAVLAHLAQVIEDPAVTATTPAQLALRALVQRREQLVQQRDDELRRLAQATVAWVQRSLQRCIRGHVQVDLATSNTGNRTQRDVVVGREEEALLDDEVARIDRRHRTNLVPIRPEDFGPGDDVSRCVTHAHKANPCLLNRRTTGVAGRGPPRQRSPLYVSQGPCHVSYG